MNTPRQGPIEGKADGAFTYLDIQAEAGITKHMGGFAATDELHRLCNFEEAEEVLEVGCGIGIGPAHIAKGYDCRVMAVDVSEKMLAWARRRARREGVLDRVDFRQADIRALPFNDDRFDAAIAESVLAFVEEKEAAIQEMIRVTKPGGFVGLNECYWIQEPPAETRSRSVAIGTEVISEDEWRKIWEATDLMDRSIQTHRLDSKQEIRDRIGWIGWRSILPAWGRLIKLMLTNPSMRDSMKTQLDSPTDMFLYLGYGLFVGRKPKR